MIDVTGGSAGAGAAGGAGGSAGTIATTGGSGGSPLATPTLIYANTDTTLFQLDPSSADLALTKVGDFDCVPGKTTAMTDLAVNAQGQIWGVSGHAVWPLTIQEGGVVACGTPIKFADPSVRFYALSFAPVGVLDPDKEVLVAGNTAGELWSIDEQGQVTLRGTFGQVPADDGRGHTFANPGTAWELAGDIVFLANNGSPVGYATVRDCPSPPDTTNCSFTNTLLEIDLSRLAVTPPGSVTKAVRGQIVPGPSCPGSAGGKFGNLYGIAAWNDQVYGFSRSGNLMRLDGDKGTGCLVEAYASDLFAGAGVTTLAPVVPPPIE